MKLILTGKQMKEADSYTIEKIGISSLVLMERAALGCVEKIIEHSSTEQTILVVCGSGNNGGDGYAIARLLHLKGYKVSILFAGNEDARTLENAAQKKICDYYKIPIVNAIEEHSYDVIIDAIFGLGLSRDIIGNYENLIRRLNSLNAYKISIDIPSGIHDCTGKVMNIAFQADLTITIAYMKRGIVIQPGNVYAGKIEIIDIGVYEDGISSKEDLMFTYSKHDLEMVMPKRKANSHKGSYGKVGLIVGSKGMSGAAFLCAKAAYMTGAGLVQVLTHEDNREILQTLLPEAIITTYTEFEQQKVDQLIEWADVLGIGCGLGQSDVSKKIVRYVCERDSLSLVIDADGLNILAEDMSILKNRQGITILTPHMKEMARMLQCDVKNIQDKRVELLEDFVRNYPVTCVLKDARTIVLKEGQKIYINMTGNSSMAKGGSGDVLTGIISGLLVQKKEEFHMAALGVFLHGMAGDKAKEYKGSFSVLASDLLYCLTEVLKQI